METDTVGRGLAPAVQSGNYEFAETDAYMQHTTAGGGKPPPYSREEISSLQMVLLVGGGLCAALDFSVLSAFP